MRNSLRFPLFAILLLILSELVYTQPNGIPTISTVAGNGISAGIPATSVGIGDGRGIAVDPIGNLFIADSVNHVVRKVDLSGHVTVAAGNGSPGWRLDIGIDECCNPGHIGDGGPAVDAKFGDLEGIAADGLFDLFINDTGNVIRKVDSNGIITTAAGTGTPGFSGDGGLATNAQIDTNSIAGDGLGNLYIANWIEACQAVIRKVNKAGVIDTIAGNGTCGSTGDGGPAKEAQVSVQSLAADTSGNLYFVEGLIVKPASALGRIRKISSGGIISTIAGTGPCGYSGDGGPAINAQVCALYVAVEPNGTVYFSQLAVDGPSQDQPVYVRKIDLNGIITTIAGDGNAGYSGDGGASYKRRSSRRLLSRR
jgi:hypothetical protein